MKFSEQYKSLKEQKYPTEDVIKTLGRELMSLRFTLDSINDAIEYLPENVQNELSRLHGDLFKISGKMINFYEKKVK